MSKSYAVLPCNGLDKCAGCVAREAAMSLVAFFSWEQEVWGQQ